VPTCTPRPSASAVSPLLLPFLLALAACSSDAVPPASGPKSGPATVSCPSPARTFPREDCAEIGEDFAALTVAGALKVAGTSPGYAARVDAIRAAGALANALKEERVKLCEAYDSCKVSVKDHAEQDAQLAGLMRSLIDLWNARRFGTPAEAAQFKQSLAALHRRFVAARQAAGGAGDEEGAPPEPKRVRAAEALAAIPSAEIAFRADGGLVKIGTQDAASHDAVRARPEVFPLLSGGHYLVKVTGTYTPATAPLLAPGDEVVARLKFRASSAGDLSVALRSLEDPDASEATTSWHVEANEKGAHEANLTASPEESGFYLGVAWKGDAAIDLDEVELVRAGQVIAAARAETDQEPFVKTTRAASTSHPIAGRRSLHCGAGAGGDAVTLGLPPGHLFIALREGAVDRVVVRTLSLMGGRSLDASLEQDGQLVIGLAGPGEATLQAVEVTDLTSQAPPAPSAPPASPPPAAPAPSAPPASPPPAAPAPPP
jgi:hypothetical protein